MATRKGVKKKEHSTSPRLTLRLSSPLKGRIKAAAAAQGMTVSVYVEGILEQVLPRPVAKLPSGIVTSRMIERADVLRKRQKEPFPEDSADLIREAREERYSRL